MVMGSEVGKNTSVYDKELLKPERFHDIHLETPARLSRGEKQRLYDEVEKHFHSLLKGKCDDLEWVNMQCWKISCKEYVTVKGLERMVYKECEKSKRWKDAQVKCGIQSCARKKITGDHLLSQIQDNYSNLDEIVSHFISIVSPAIHRDFYLPKKPRKKRIIDDKNRVRMAETGVRVRKNWTVEEISILTEMRKKNAKWRDIAAKLPDRTNMDCKDKWRNLDIQKEAKMKKEEAKQS